MDVVDEFALRLYEAAAEPLLWPGLIADLSVQPRSPDTRQQLKSILAKTR